MTTITAATTTNTGLYLYWPEMGQAKPSCDMTAFRSFYGTHYYIDSPAALKGRGITDIGSNKPGVFSYRVTKAAFEKLQGIYAIAMECLLD